MADLNRRGIDSYAHKSNVLTYGHFGTATYSTGDGSWNFLRQEDEEEISDGEAQDSTRPWQNNLELIEGPTLHPSPIPALDIDELHISDNAKFTSLNHILTHVPEICAVSELYSSRSGQHEFSTEALESLPGGDIIAFGDAALLGDDGFQFGGLSVPIMVSVHGSGRDQIVFSCLHRGIATYNESVGLQIQLEIPKLVYDETALWSAGGLVDRIRASPRSSSHGQTRFAAITQFGTSIFRPKLHTFDVARPLASNHVLDIPWLYTGGQQHADVCFHPQSPDVLAIVDSWGTWSTWNVTSQSSHSTRRTQRARLLASGHLPHDHKVGTGRNTSSYPIGWHRICWLSSTGHAIDRLAICNRENVCMFDLAGRTDTHVALNILQGVKAGRILDFATSSTSLMECFILTSSHILWMSTSMQHYSDQLQSQNLNIIASWNHFRGRTDHSMSMHLLEHLQEKKIVLYSRITKTLTVYKATRTSYNRFSIAEPSLLAMPLDVMSNSRFHLQNCQVKRQGTKINHANLWFCKLLVPQANGTIEECTIRLPTSLHGRVDSPPGEQIGLPRPRAQYHRSARLLVASESDDSVDDRADMESVNIMGLQTIEPALKSLSRPIIPSQSQSTGCELSSTYNNIIGSISQPDSGQSQGVEQFQSSIRRLLQDETASLTNHLISELAMQIPYIAEIEDDSALLSTFLDDISSQSENITDNGRRLLLEQIDKQSLMEIYESIVHQWMVPLSSTVPDRTRIFRERLARQIAFDVWLSNIAIRRSEAVSIADSRTTLLTEEDDDRPQATLSSAGYAGLPPDITSSAIRDQVDETHASNGTMLLTSLVNFTNPLPNQFSSDLFEDILAHIPISIDEDPAQYDYDATEIGFAASQTELKHSQSDPRIRRKIERLTKSRQRQLEKQEKVKKVTFDARSTVPAVTSSQLPFRNVQSSQAGPPSSSQPDSQSVSAINMSQPERGPFGARTTKKAKKSKGERRAGF